MSRSTLALQGVCHRVVVEQYGLPGTVIVLTDSHTPTAGVLNAFAFGVGSTAMAFALDHPATTAAVVGTITPANLERNVAAARRAVGN